MNNRTGLICVGLVIAATAGCAAAASAAVPTGAPHEELAFAEVRSQTEFADEGEIGGPPGPGDAYFFESQLYSHDRGDAGLRRPIGRFLSMCTVTFGGNATCSGALLLGDGTIEVAGAPDLGAEGPIRAAVVGGTGRYAGVGGEITITPTEVEGTSDLLVHLGRGATTTRPDRVGAT